MPGAGTDVLEHVVRILLVSDNPKLSMGVASAALGDSDSDLVEVRTPQRAVALLDDGERFDVVVGDADTAPSGGFFLAREIKARGQMGRDMPPVVLLLARDQDRFLSNWSQADAYVGKPVDPFNLREVLQSLAAGEGVPELPGVGGEPTPSLLDIPGGDSEADANYSAGGLPAGPG
ncbi:MAG: response regulator [Nitriliruptorales bacterium]|nr:response regulator [Nitriliruptorales bacterium]